MKKFERDVKAVKKALQNRPRGLQLAQIALKSHLLQNEVFYILKCLIEDKDVVVWKAGHVPIYSLNREKE